MARFIPPRPEQMIVKAAKEAGVDPALFKRLILRGERSWKGWQTSPAGASGPSQLMPGTAQGLAEKYGIDPNDYYGNLLGGAYYLRDMLKTFKDPRKAVAAYNAGPGNVEKYGGVPPFAETQRYVSNIFAGGWKPGRAQPAAVQTNQSAPAPQAPGFTPPARGPNFAAPQQRPTFNALAAMQSMATGGSAMDALASMFDNPIQPKAPKQRQQGPPVTVTPAPVMTRGVPAAGAPAPGPASTVKLGNFVRPLSTPMPGGSEFGYVDAEGAPDRSGTRHHAGKDWFAPGGSPVYAPVGGKVVEVRESRGTSGQVFGGVVKIQDRNGRVYVFRHVDPGRFKEGQQVKPGTRVGSVTAWRDGSPHAHIEIWKTLNGGYNYENMLDPAQVFGG